MSSSVALNSWRTRLKQGARTWLPTGVVEFARGALDYVGSPQWEYMSAGWDTSQRVRGWDISAVVEAQKKNWTQYSEYLSKRGPLWLNHEDLHGVVTEELRDHNTLVSYAYVAALASRHSVQFSMLDWGGGLGYYYLVSRAVLPGLDIDYCCYDMPSFCDVGRDLLPGVKFTASRRECLIGHYDLVLASSSLWYDEDWKTAVGLLAAVADPYLFITRMVFLDDGPSYVAIQRPWSLGFPTEYLCWILNQQELVECLNSHSMELVREFALSDGPHIHNAPAQGKCRGLLFAKKRA